MNEQTKELEAFVKKNGPDILKEFNEVLKQHEPTTLLRVEKVKMSYATDFAQQERITVEKVEGGYIIWKNR